MTDPVAGGLTRTTDIPVLVRLVVDRDWQLARGELVDVNDVSRGRFTDWAGLQPAVRRFLEEERVRRAGCREVTPGAASRDPEGRQ